jgi:hypothetical protein
VATEKWIAGSGQGLTYGDAFSTATLNSIASGNAILSDLQIDNSTALDMFCDVSIALASAAFVAPNFIDIYLYPLNKDNTTYGDGRFASSAAGPPGGSYQHKTISIVATTAAQEGTAIGFVLPPGKFKFVFDNHGGVALAVSGNTCQYRTYNRSVV